MALLQIVKLGGFLMQVCRMEIIHLRFAPMGLEELAVLAINGLLVKNLPLSFSSYHYFFFILPLNFNNRIPLIKKTLITESCLNVLNINSIISLWKGLTIKFFGPPCDKINFLEL